LQQALGGTTNLKSEVNTYKVAIAAGVAFAAALVLAVLHGREGS
jgi:hypothetical protein